MGCSSACLLHPHLCGAYRGTSSIAFSVLPLLHHTHNSTFYTAAELGELHSDHGICIILSDHTLVYSECITELQRLCCSWGFGLKYAWKFWWVFNIKAMVKCSCYWEGQRPKPNKANECFV